MPPPGCSSPAAKCGTQPVRTASPAGRTAEVPEPKPDPVANPTFTPDPGVFAPPVSVTISSPTEGASIKYTLDGTMPSVTDGLAYSGPIGLNRSVTINAIAFKDGLPTSGVVTAEFALPKIYVARTNDGEVTVIAGATGAILTSIMVGNGPVGIAANPNTGRVWVANNGDDSVTVIDAETNTAVNTITSIPGVRQITVNPITNTVYVTANEIGVIDSVYPIVVWLKT